MTNEKRVKDIFNLFKNTIADLTPNTSVADEVLKVDIRVKVTEEERTDVYAIQVKSSSVGCDNHYANNVNLTYEGVTFTTPYCINAGLTNIEIYDLICEEFYLEPNIDWDLLNEISIKIKASNGKRISSKLYSLNKVHRTALRLLFNISCNKNTYFIK